MALTIFIFAASFKTWYPALQLTSSSIVPVVILHRPETGVQLLLSLVGKNYPLQRLQSTSCRDRVTMIGQVLGVRAVRGFGRFQAEAQAIRRNGCEVIIFPAIYPVDSSLVALRFRVSFAKPENRFPKFR